MQGVLIAVVEVERHQDANADIVVGLDELLQRRRLRSLVVLLQKRKAERFDLGLKLSVVALERLGKRANTGAAENTRKGEQANQPLRRRYGYN